MNSDCRSRECDGLKCVDPTSCPGAGVGEIGVIGRSSLDAASEANDGAMGDLQPIPDVAAPAELFVGNWTFASGSLTPQCAVGGVDLPPLALAGMEASIQQVSPTAVVLAIGNACSVSFEVTGNVAAATAGQTCQLDWGGSVGPQSLSIASWTLTRSGDHLDETVNGSFSVCTVTGSDELVQ
jgi:hypothetical protein